MDNRARFIAFALLAVMISLPAFAQDRTRPAGEATAGRTVAAAPDVRGAASGISSRATSAPSYGGFGGYSNPSNRGFNPSPSSSSPSPAIGWMPRLQGTSFYTYGQYFYWNDFLYQLRNRYFFDPMYFSRFYRNSEPLLTPGLQRLAVRDPLMLSRQMIGAVDELSQMIEARQAGQPIARELIVAKVREIRELAKKIRGDKLLPYVDQRKEMDVLGGRNVNSLGFGAIEELRGMALDLNSQLRNLYAVTSTASISVSELSQPSFSSLSKGIERLCKVIENSAKAI
jgi:hypothetical protein